jgi:hypothetical protein
MRLFAKTVFDVTLKRFPQALHFQRKSGFEK